MLSKHLYIVFLSAFLVVFASCNANSSIVPGAKTVKVNLNMKPSQASRERLPISDDSSMLGAVAVHRVNNSEVLFFMMAGDYCFRYWNVNKGETSGILRRGNGPGELPDGAFASAWTGEEGDSYISVYSMAIGKYMDINLTKTLSEGKTVVRQETFLPSTTFYAHRVGDGIGCYVFSHSQELSWKRIRDGEIQEEWEPFNTEGLNPQEQFFAGTAVSADGKYLVMGMTAFPRLYIFDLETGRKLAVAPDMHGDAQVRAYLQKNLHPQKEYYNGVVIEGDKIYAMYLDPAPLIQVFDFDGKLLKTIDIHDSLVNFIVSEGAIIGITMDGEVFRYEEK